MDLLGPTHGLPELLAGAAVVGLHLWKKNTLLLSIAVGTALYMVLVQGGVCVTRKMRVPKTSWPPLRGPGRLVTHLPSTSLPQLLVVYCLRGVDLLGPTHGLPELLAGAAVVGLHLWKKNTLLSIAVGTALYMVLVQAVFV